MRHKHFHPFPSVYCLIVLGSTKLVQMSNSKHPRAVHPMVYTGEILQSRQRNTVEQKEKYCKAVDCLIVLVSDNKQHLLGLSTGLHWHHSRMRPKDPRVPACYKHYTIFHCNITLHYITFHSREPTCYKHLLGFPPAHGFHQSFDRFIHVFHCFCVKS